MTPGRWVRLYAARPSATVPPASRALLSLPGPSPLRAELPAAGNGTAKVGAHTKDLPELVQQPWEQAQRAQRVEPEAASEPEAEEAAQGPGGSVRELGSDLDAEVAGGLPPRWKKWLKRHRHSKHGKHGRHGHKRHPGSYGGTQGSAGKAMQGSRSDWHAAEPSSSGSYDEASYGTEGGSDGGSADSGGATQQANRQASEGGLLPLPNGLAEDVRDAAALGLFLPEEGNITGNGTDRAPALAAPGTLDAYIYGQNAVDSGSVPFSGERVRFASRVAAAGDGWVELERPLPYDLHPEWQVGAG